MIFYEVQLIRNLKFFIFIILFFTSGCITFVKGQSSDKSAVSNWTFNTEADFNFYPDDFYILPFFRADKNKLHLEARYNYENRETFSGWAGYNFKAGENSEVLVIPMIGGVAGKTNAFGTGLELTLNYKSLQFYSESEYIMDFESSDDNFFYTWTDLSCTPYEWFSFGLSGQVTINYDSKPYFQEGVLLGTSYKNWSLTTYVYNPFADDRFITFALVYGF